MRRTKIVATIGPASESPEILRALLRAGLNVARLNMSHGEQADHRRRIDALRAAARETGRPIAILVDLRGPAIRIGNLPGGAVQLEPGQAFTFTTLPGVSETDRVSVSHPGLPRDVEPGATLLLDDGNLAMEVVEVSDLEVRCRVTVGGLLRDRKKINLPGRRVSLPAVSEKDAADIRFAAEQGVDFLAASFVRKAADVLEVRRVLEACAPDCPGAASIQIIAKIESGEGIDNLEEILKVADGLMVARGDLGVEVPAEDIPLHQKRMIERCNALGKPVITATQMLESMISLPRPTRAEASDVANAILDGTDAVMLSAESASGKYPLESVRMMARIAERTESALDHARFLHRVRGAAASVTDAISRATVEAAQDLGAAAIITATHSGHTARMVSKYRPSAPIIAVTPNADVARRLCLVWGVEPVLRSESNNTDEMIDRAVAGALETGLVRAGDLVVITAGVPVGIPGTTNLIKVHTVGEVILRGTGIGSGSAAGRVIVVSRADRAALAAEAEAPASARGGGAGAGSAGVGGPGAGLASVGGPGAGLAARFRPGDVLVAEATDRELVPFMERAAAIIVEEGGLTSHAAIVGVSLGIPTVVGAEGATRALAEGMLVTVDAARGLIYRGQARAL